MADIYEVTALSPTNEDQLAPAVTDLFEEAQERTARRLSRRERRVETIAAAAFLAVAVPVAVLAPSPRAFSAPLAIVLVAAYACAARVKFPVGAGFTVPTQPFFVVMLFVLPPAAAPLLVASGFLLAEVPDFVRRRTHPERALLPLGDAWHALGPALVFSLARAGGPTWADWPLYVAALASQFAVDSIAMTIREWFALGIPPAAQIAERVWLYVVDALLAPMGLMAAFASVGHRYNFLLCLPVVALLNIFARERTERMRHTVELSKTYRGTAHLLGDVVEADDAYTGSHSRSVVVPLDEGREEDGALPSALRNVEFAALLHDVGKIAIPKEVINKPGPLDEHEWRLIKTHTVEGQNACWSRSAACSPRWVESCARATSAGMGAGYPDGLAGEAIPVEARIVCACDAFNAMTTTRVYRKAMSSGSRWMSCTHVPGCSSTQRWLSCFADRRAREDVPRPGRRPTAHAGHLLVKRTSELHPGRRGEELGQSRGEVPFASAVQKRGLPVRGQRCTRRRCN